MIILLLKTGFFIVRTIEATLGISPASIGTHAIIQPLTSAIVTVNGYLANVFYFIPKTLFLMGLAIIAWTSLVRIVMAVINLIKW